MSELLLGCGGSRQKKMRLLGDSEEWKGLVTLDNYGPHNPDVLHDLEVFPYPFEDNQFNEIHAYEVLEHTGSQGDYRFFFRQFEELHRILKPRGKLYASVPRWDSIWAWADPSHKRVISEGSLIFLSQEQYNQQVGKTAMSDFRAIYNGDFRIHYTQDSKEQFWFVLVAIK